MQRHDEVLFSDACHKTHNVTKLCTIYTVLIVSFNHCDVCMIMHDNANVRVPVSFCLFVTKMFFGE